MDTGEVGNSAPINDDHTAPYMDHPSTNEAQKPAPDVKEFGDVGGLIPRPRDDGKPGGESVIISGSQ
jgi:hypothetical protein